MRPMLKSWLDDNLPGLVERVVRAEIETRFPRPRLAVFFQALKVSISAGAWLPEGVDFAWSGRVSCPPRTPNKSIPK